MAFLCSHSLSWPDVGIYNGLHFIGFREWGIRNEPWFSTWRFRLTWWHLTISEDNFDYHDCGERGCAIGMQCVEARGATKYPTLHSTASTTKNHQPKCQSCCGWEPLGRQRLCKGFGYGFMNSVLLSKLCAQKSHLIRILSNIYTFTFTFSSLLRVRLQIKFWKI